MALKDGALKFVVFLGTVRDGNFGQRAAKFIVKKLEARGHQTTLLGNPAHTLATVRWSRPHTRTHLQQLAARCFTHTHLLQTRMCWIYLC